jgi:hypothetical protein
MASCAQVVVFFETLGMSGFPVGRRVALRRRFLRVATHTLVGRFRPVMTISHTIGHRRSIPAFRIGIMHKIFVAIHAFYLLVHDVQFVRDYDDAAC